MLSPTLSLTSYDALSNAMVTDNESRTGATTGITTLVSLFASTTKLAEPGCTAYLLLSTFTTVWVPAVRLQILKEPSALVWPQFVLDGEPPAVRNVMFGRPSPWSNAPLPFLSV